MDPTMTLATAQAAEGYRALGVGPLPSAAPKADPFGDMARAAEDFVSTLREAETLGAQAVTGGGDPHALVTALAETRMAMEATVAVRDRVVEAYQELLRMQV